MARSGGMLTDVHVRSVRFEFEPVGFRVPLKFGSGTVSEITYAVATVEVETGRGARATGRGAIFLSDLWAYPTQQHTHQERDAAMRAACGEVAAVFQGARGHPIDIVMERKDDYARIAREVTQQFSLRDPLPVLAVQVCASPVDAAIHDAFGNVNGIDSYAGYGAELWRNDLSRYLGAELKGLRPDAFLAPAFRPSLPVFHLVGGADKLRDGEVTADDPQDGLPVSLEEWIRRDGVFCLKVKLRGTDVEWDVARTGAVADVAAEALRARGVDRFYLSTDANELCPSPETVVEYLDKLKEKHPRAYDALLYVEQPTERDIACHRFDMRAVAARKPVLADEGITSVEGLRLARELGWSGVALKVCKGHTSALLYVALAGRWGMPYSVQDLTNPGMSLVHSAGFAARISPMMGVEANARQFLLDPEREMRGLHPGLFRVKDGKADLTTLRGTGLGYCWKLSDSGKES